MYFKYVLSYCHQHTSTQHYSIILLAEVVVLSCIILYHDTPPVVVVGSGGGCALCGGVASYSYSRQLVATVHCTK